MSQYRVRQKEPTDDTEQWKLENDALIQGLSVYMCLVERPAWRSIDYIVERHKRNAPLLGLRQLTRDQIEARLQMLVDHGFLDEMGDN